MPDHNLNKLNYSSTRLHFQASFRAKHVCVTRVLPCTLYVCEEVCLVPEAEINMTSVAIFTQIILHTADSQFHRAGVCLGSCYVHTIQLLWKTGRHSSS